MEEKRFMVKNFWLLHENHDNKVDEKCDGSGKDTKKRQVPNCFGICLHHLWEMII